MKFLVFSDVHGNLPALELTLQRVGNVDGYISLGDVVNYGPWSNECLDLLHSLKNITFIEGNHETYFLNGSYTGTNTIARTFFEFCYPNFNRQTEIRGQLKDYKLKDFTFTHTIDNTYIYPDSKVVLDRNYVIGHSHHQFKIEQAPYVLYNPGSIGQNRKYINVINYALVDTETMRLDLKGLKYNEMLIINEMKACHYPKLCIDYYNDKERLV